MNEKELWDLAERYHEECELFDQTHCSARNDRGIAVPTTPEETRAISRNAREVLARLCGGTPTPEQFAAIREWEPRGGERAWLAWLLKKGAGNGENVER